ncbi:MAG: hypothetical protein GX189_03550 [Clostridiales bacterium]|nr:hypothetical protein [Clostridiales bacterium]
MYNRYIGNTGRVIRVEEAPPPPPRGGIHHRPPPPPPPPEEPPPPPPPSAAHAPPKPGGAWQSSGFKSFPSAFTSPRSGGALSGLLKNFSGGLRDGPSFLKGLLGNLPFGLDLGDILLLLLLLFFYIESGDEEFLIILAFLVFSIVKEGK